MLVFGDNEIQSQPRVESQAPVRTPQPHGTRPPNYRIIVKREATPDDMRAWISTVPGLLQGLTQTVHGDNTVLYDYQFEHVSDWAVMRHRDKCRQAGYSWITAGEGLAKCHLKRVHTSAYISYNHEDAMDKIRAARMLYDTIPTEFQKKLLVDNKHSLEFGYGKSRTRMVSIAQRQPRGLGEETDVNLDEFAFMQYARLIFSATVPVLSRGGGVLTVGSTPWGKNSLHYEIGADRRNYWMFSRMKIFWWHCPALCIDVERARKEAPAMSTLERVQTFGTDKLMLLFSSMELDEFRREYELYYADEKASYFPLSLLAPCTFADEEGIRAGDVDPEEFVMPWEELPEGHGYVERPETVVEIYDGHKIKWVCFTLKLDGNEKGSEELLELASDFIDRFALATVEGVFGTEMVLGMDIGRDVNSSEISLFEEKDIDDYNIAIQRMQISFDSVKYRVQEAILRMILRRLRVRAGKIDSTGIGDNLAENISDEFPSIITSEKFIPTNKAEWAKTFRMRLEDHTVAILNDTESLKQIHAIKRSVTENAVERYTVDGSKKHHGDRFWSMALAVSCAHHYERRATLLTGVRSSSERIFRNASDVMRAIDNQRVVRVAKVPQIIASPRVAGLVRSSVAKNPLNDLFFDTKFYG